MLVLSDQTVWRHIQADRNVLEGKLKAELFWHLTDYASCHKDVWGA
jgi:hypothetical protein